MADFVDLYEAEDVELVVHHHNDGWRMWVNVEGANRLRIYRIKHLTLRTKAEVYESKA